VKRPWRRQARPNPIEHQILLTATLCLMAGGAVMVYSASSARTLLEGSGDGTAYLVKYVMYGAFGLVIMQVMARRGLELAERFGKLLLLVGFVLIIAVKLPGIGVEVNGARRWIGAGPLTFQPSEIMKLALVLYAAGLLADKPQRLRTLKGIVSPLLVVAGVAAVLIASQPDLGTALVIGFTMCAMLVAAGAPMRHMGTLAAGTSGAVMLFALFEPYRRERLMSFLDPWAHASDAGFQAVQGQIALGSGGLFGLGPGQSVQKIFYLPEAHTDFILAVIGEELGVVGVTVLMCLYGMIAYGGLRAAKAAKTQHAQLVAAGVTSLILSQALLNTFTVLGLAPLTGVPLPFVSAGSTSITVLLAGMGLLLNIASGRHTHLRAVPSGSRHEQDADRHRGRGHGGARGARAGGRRRAAG
jgi:cell division protein FtsW